MATTDEEVLQVVRGYVKAYSVTGTARTDKQVVVADDKAPRPPKPYVTVKVMVFDTPDGFDEEIPYDLRGTPQQRQRGQRNGTVSIQGYGAETSGWLERLALQHMLPDGRATLETGKIFMEPLGGIINVSTLVGTEIEPRFSRDFAFTYEIITPLAEAQTQVPLVLVVLNLTAGDKESGASDEYTETVEIDT